jgi:hypothetical protein
MIIICGKTIAEVERDLEMAKQAIASGMPYGIGGETIKDVEQAMDMLSAVADNAPISNPNYEPPHSCGCSCDYCDCNVCGGCEDEEDDPCEDCEGEYEGCGNYCEDGLSEKDIDRILERLGVPKTLYDLVRQELGLL